MNPRAAAWILGGVVLASVSCAPKKPVAQTAPPPPSAEGKTSYAYIFDPANPALGLPEDVQFVRPMAIDAKTLPRYPEPGAFSPGRSGT